MDVVANPDLTPDLDLGEGAPSAGLRRYAAGVEYVGSDWSGWQALSGRQTLQATLEAALSRVADHPLIAHAAGRTDAGVHALQQVVHFDTTAERSEYGWLLGTNSLLPDSISLRWLRPVPSTFHARHATIRRHYRYVIHNHRARSALLHGRVAWWPQPLDALAMHAAAQQLIGEHDFTSFRDSQCQAPTATRELMRIKVERRLDFIVIDVCGNAFLHHMVRNIAGTLLVVGQRKQAPEWVGEVLRARDRTRAGMTAPAAGLCFVGPEYPAEFALPPPPLPWFP